MAQLKDTTISGGISVSGISNLAGSAQVSGGDLTLYTASGDSPAIVFQRGILGDSYNDWRVRDSGGHLLFDQRGATSGGWSNVGTWNSSSYRLISNGGFSSEITKGYYLTSGSYTGQLTAETLTASRTWTLPDKTGTIALTSDIEGLGGGTITSITTTAGAHSTINVTSGAAAFNVPTNTSHLTNDSGFVDSLIGSTSNITPTQVVTALTAGKTLYITHPIDIDQSIVATYFDYAPTMGLLVSNIVVYYLNQYFLYTLTGETINDTWSVSNTSLAQRAELPTTALSSTTGISIAAHGTTSVGSASGWSAGSASVSNHILSFTAPTLTITSTTVTTGTTHSITDNGHTHSLT